MRLLLVSLTLLLALAAPGAAQELVPELFPRLTGKNGYEELVRAIDVLRASKLLQKAETRDGEGGTLTYRRRVLQEKPVVEALRLVRLGLSKPIASPHLAPGPQTRFPEFSGFRRLARLLQIQQYVLLADGRSGEAIEVSRLGLRLAGAVQQDTLISGLVGIAISAIATAPLGAHLDQLSARDCEALYRLCDEWLAQPDPTLRIMEGERRFGLRAMEEMHQELRKQGPAALREFTGDDEESRKLRAQLPTNQAEMERMLRRVVTETDRFYQGMFAELRKPYWQRKIENPEVEGIAGTLIGMVTPVFSQAMAAYARDRSRIQLLACHAAVLRYRWEHNRLPASLDELHLGERAVDAFTGQPLRYEPAGLRYRLYSVGPETGPEDERAIEGRRPVSVVPDEF